MEELKVGASYLRNLNSDALAKLDQKLVVHTEGVPVAVIMPWAEHERMIGLAPVMIERGSAEPSPEFKAEVREMVEKVRALPLLEEIGTLLGHLLDSAEPRAGAVEDFPPFIAPKTRTCKHCGGMYAGPKTSSICSDCKSGGHTLAPAECPRCTEGEAI
jgi:hypothetical protein